VIADALKLTFTLLSDTTFGRGDGVVGEVDAEVQHDELGLPYFGGRTLKGVLVMECADLLFALNQSESGRWWNAAAMLFGLPGSTEKATGALIVGDACLPSELCEAVRFATSKGRKAPLLAEQILASLTTIRKQTANDVATGAPQDETLRAMRVVLRKTTFTAPLRFRIEVGDDELALLAACVQALRRLGTGRHRGRGEVEAHLTNVQGLQVTDHFDRFVAEVAHA